MWSLCTQNNCRYSKCQVPVSEAVLITPQTDIRAGLYSQSTAGITLPAYVDQDHEWLHATTKVQRSQLLPTKTVEG